MVVVYTSVLILCGQIEFLRNIGALFGGAIDSHLSMHDYAQWHISEHQSQQS